MRTEVVTTSGPNAGDADDPDVWPDCAGSVDDQKILTVHMVDGLVEESYEPHEWASFTTYND